MGFISTKGRLAVAAEPPPPACLKLLQFTDHQLEFEKLLRQAGDASTAGKIPADAVELEKKMSDTAQAIFSDTHTDFQKLENGDLLISPNAHGSRLNKIADRLSQLHQTKVIYSPTTLIQDPGTGAFTEGQTLFLPHHVVLNVNLERSDVLDIVLSIGLTLHEVRHVWLNSLDRKGIDSLFQGRIESVSPKIPLSSEPTWVYTHHMGLGEITAFPLHLELWTLALDQLSLENQKLMAQSILMHAKIGRATVRQLNTILIDETTHQAKITHQIESTVKNDKLGNETKSLTSVNSLLGQVNVTYDLPLNHASSEDFNQRTKLLVELTQQANPIYDELIQATESFVAELKSRQSGLAFKNTMRKLTEKLRVLTSRK